ncbi:MAG: tetratricopeptide repeat protein [Bacteroidia bacterium]
MSYQYIDTLLSTLNESEKRTIEYHFSGKSNSEELLKRKYIEHITGISKNEEKNIAVNRMLKSRAFDEMTDVLISDHHIHNKGNFAPHDQVLLRLKKKILLARVISKNLNQNKMGPFKTFLNTIISEAEKHEVYEVLIEALNLKKYFFAIQEGGKEFQKADNRVSFFELCQKKVYYASDCYFRIVINNNLLKFKSDKAFHSYVLNTIRLLKIDYQKYGSAQINYYLQIILMFYYEKKKKYALSAKYCKILLFILKNTPVIYREERVGYALIDLSQYKTFTNNFNDAIRYIKEAQKYFLENSNNFLASKRQEFHAYFYHKKYDKALGCINELLNHKLADSGSFNQAKYIYFQSALYFAQHKFKQALGLLNKSLELEKEKSAWNVSLKILNIMLYIELNKLDDASRSLESLRKYIQRNSKTHDIKPRDILIVKALREFEKGGFMVNHKNTILSKMLKDLSQKGKSISWEYYTPELIPFHEWLGAKL